MLNINKEKIMHVNKINTVQQINQNHSKKTVNTQPYFNTKKNVSFEKKLNFNLLKLILSFFETPQKPKTLLTNEDLKVIRNKKNHYTGLLETGKAPEMIVQHEGKSGTKEGLELTGYLRRLQENLKQKKS